MKRRLERIRATSSDDPRTPFQRDRDRVLYSPEFRRLSGVTQVASAGEGDVFHNRLTHSPKVAQVGRRLAERLAKDYFVLEVQESRDFRRQLESTTLNKTTGPDGSARQTFFNIDPSAEPGDVAFLDLDVRSSADLEVRDGTAVGIVEDDGSADDDVNLEWSDQRAEPTTLLLHVAREYIVASSSGSGAAATVQAILSDQYGGPVRGEQVVFSPNDSRGVPNGVRRTTNSRGVASLNYQQDSSEGFTERITGSFDRIRDTTRQFWVMRLSGAADGSGTVLTIVETPHSRSLKFTHTEGALFLGGLLR